MSESRSFPERAERVLIASMLAGIVMITQRYSIDLFRWGLGLLVAATFLQIAVGNLPRDASFGRSVVLIAAILGIVAAVFTVGVWLVPVLARLGR
jgi:hypothetical protein